MTGVLVTGASGFVGTNLIRKLLQSNEKVNVIMRPQSKLWRLKDVISKLDVYTVDVNNAKSLKMVLQKIKPRIVFHLAAYGGYPFQQELVSTMNNIHYGVNLMSALEDCEGFERFVNAGSSSEYGPKSKLMEEIDSTQPITPYGISKLAQTLFAQYFYKQKKLPTVTLRLFSVYGPYEEPGRLIYDTMTAIIKKRVLKLSSPKPRRDFVYVDDVTSALLKAANVSNVEGEVFNIGSGIDYSVGDVVNITRDLTKIDLKVVWGFEEKKRGFDTDTMWIADIKKASKILGWKPQISLEGGLLQTYDWYCKNINLYEGVSN